MAEKLKIHARNLGGWWDSVGLEQHKDITQTAIVGKANWPLPPKNPMMLYHTAGTLNLAFIAHCYTESKLHSLHA